MDIADVFDAWRETRGLNVNRAIRLLIDQVVAERSPVAPAQEARELA